MCSVAFLSAIVTVFAFWASLGKGHPLLRYCLLVVMLLVLGAGMGTTCVYGGGVQNRWLWRTGNWSTNVSLRSYDYDLYRWYEVGWWWIAWMFLSGGLLAASLMIFRAVGYRLVRCGKPASGRYPERVT